MGSNIREIVRRVGFRALMLVDIALLAASLGLAALLRTGSWNWSTIAQFLASKVSLASFALFAIAVVICHSIFLLCNLYESKRLSTKTGEVADILRAVTICALFLWFGARALSIAHLQAHFLISFWAIACLLIIETRMLVRYLLTGIRKRGRNVHHILVLGTNARAVEFGRKIEAMPERGYRLLGFVDDVWPGFGEFKESGFTLACTNDGITEFLRKNVVDEIAIFLPLRSFYERAADVARLAKQYGILVRLDTDVFNLRFAHARTDATGGSSQIISSGRVIAGWQLLFKRGIDILGSLALLIILSPLFVIVAAWIKLTSPDGPVFFSQKRVGINKRQFMMFKFRTMVPDAENIQEKFAHLNEMSGPVFKITNDPRITPIGHILRKTSIDELPQLFNVLAGDMSLVGPRAMSLRDYQLFNEDWQRRRFSVAPGITCLWQVHGRNTIPFDQWMVLDMQYIDAWSLWLDIKILALTVPAVFKGFGAG
ncbi:MAG TPA: sugar transferase [Candidatus Acidoferrales bacterium]|jgi:exopolysaccharide biosynthesis polyprenyl glycosylphosphotransferase|nr:sugar transferase [Candidatus Acidoferrales bacterium]